VLVAAWAGLFTAMFALIVAAPGLPEFGSEERSGWVLTSPLIVFFLWRGSRIAWWIALLLTAPTVPLYANAMLNGHGYLGFDPKGLAAVLLGAAAVVALTSPALEASLGKRRPAAVVPHP
jgi:hypothetical protein